MLATVDEGHWNLLPVQVMELGIVIDRAFDPPHAQFAADLLNHDLRVITQVAARPTDERDAH